MFLLPKMLKTLSNQTLQYKLFYKCVPQVINNILKADYGLSKNEESDKRKEMAQAILSKYQPFRESQSPVILDVEEERRKNLNNSLNQTDLDNDYDEFAFIRKTRGLEGVIDLEELVDILRRESARGIFVVEVPAEYRYVRHIVIVHGKSSKHMLGMAEFVRRVFKLKRNGTDFIPRIEGKGSKDWIALDLGNIALHIFSKTAREYYDIESLWSVGQEYDNLCNAPENPVISLLKNNSVTLTDLTPAD